MSTSRGAPSHGGSASLGTKEIQSFPRKEISGKDVERRGLSFPRGLRSHPEAPRWLARTAPLNSGSGPHSLRGSWQRPGASTCGCHLLLHWVGTGQGWRPAAPDSPEKSVAALALVGEADEGVHGSHPRPRVAQGSPVGPLGLRGSQGTVAVRVPAKWVGPGLSLRPHGGGHTFGSAEI